MEGDPFMLIEGMTIAAIATGANHGIVHIRSEYPATINKMQQAIAIAGAANYLGSNILGSPTTSHSKYVKPPVPTSVVKKPRC